MKVFQGVRGTQKQVPQVEVNVDTVYVRSNIERIEEEDFTGWQYDEVQYNKNEWHSVIGKKAGELEEDNAVLWFENIALQSKIEEAEQEVAELWFNILAGGVV